ncbi:MAG: helix-turn-helix domain-containing protein [Prevotella sp.]
MATERNPELRSAWEFVEHTGRSIFLTGKAGTGKTTFLHTVKEKSTKQMIVVAPTGVAAINAGGMTIHSFFQLPLSPYVPGAKVKNIFEFGKEKRKIMASMDLLVIDEISMVRSDLLDAIDSVLRRYRNHYKPFGGVQLLMIGDLAQLTPVVTPEDEEMLRPYYDTPYFFGSKALQQIDYVTIQLEKIYRQTDQQFVNILNNVREGRPTVDDLYVLHTKYEPTFKPKPEEGYIRLTTHNRMADDYNDREMKILTTKPYTYKAEIEGNFPELSYPTSSELTLKEGAQVMFIKNDTDGKYFNGKIGRVVELRDDSVKVVCTGESNEIEVTPQEWENAKYTINPQTHEIETEIQGLFRQYPLRLAWAITIHKSQGLTFDHAIIDAGHSFASGQVYVALSRCRSLEGLVIASKINTSAIISDERIDNYMINQEEEARRSVNQLPQLKQEYYRQLLIELFDFTTLQEKVDSMLRLMSEHFSSSNASLTQLYRQTATDFRQKVTDIAMRWTTSLGRMTFEQLHDEALLERVRHSTTYFIETIESIIGKPLELTQKVKSNNKHAMQRLNDVYAELYHLYRFHRLLLKSIADKGFSVSTYLKEKQHSSVMAMERESAKTKSQKPREKKPKVEKEQTHVVSYNLYRGGMSVADIAAKRNLNQSTIYGHLGKFVKTGDVKLEELVSANHMATIKNAIATAGIDSSRAAIKALCPDDITYSEINLVLDLYSGCSNDGV